MNNEKKSDEGHSYFHVAGVITVVQLALVFFFADPQITAVYYAGWGVWIVSIVLGWFPIHTLRAKGRVPSGESYVKTETLVDIGIYSIVRHPQYTGLVLFDLSLIMIAQHWIVGIAGAASVILAYVSTFQEDRTLIEKFGKDYVEYMEKVPRTNILIGGFRLIRRK